MSSINNETLLIDFSEESWQTLFPDIFTVTNGDNPFYTDNTLLYEERNTLRSYAIGDNNLSTMQINFSMIKDGTVEFVHKVSSESNYDWLNITIDDSQVVHVSGYTEWEVYTQELNQGEHTLSFEYTKDSSNSVGNDCGAIGYIKITGIQLPYDRKYLIKSNDKLYSLVQDDTTITPIELSETVVTSEIFRQYGFNFIPTSDMLLTFANPEILYWQDSIESDLPNMSAKLTFIPMNQNVISNAINLTHSTIKGIEKVSINCEGEVNVAFSFDNKATWKAWNGSDWVILTDNYSGMSKSVLEGITLEQWSVMFNGSEKCYIRVSLTDTNQSIEKIMIDFAN